MELSDTDKQVLKGFFNTDVGESFKNLMVLERAKYIEACTGAQSMDQLRSAQGGLKALRSLEAQVKNIGQAEAVTEKNSGPAPA